MYSVWNQGVGMFDYFQDDVVQADLNAAPPKHLASRALGSTVDQAAWPLPPDARPVGQGVAPVGRIASRTGGGALGGVLGGDDAILKAGLLAAAGFLAWRELRPRRRKVRR